ncbi:hypothetical protein ACE1CD_12040 [Aerosakkonema sp. BLCC-F183]|uniref:hypothetical protein n=1 Tax=Aerosakkonema sp. BLCC-F183 TaxID=3342834 RepID=UPI0035BB70F9
MMNKLKLLIYSVSQGNPKVFGVILISAFFVTLARILAPIEMNWDEAVQLEAAHRLVKGLGLTSTFFPPPYAPVQIPSNLNISPIPQYLTWWPPGFSLLVASLLFIGISLATSLKIIYGISTILGWFAWGILGSNCLSKPIKIGSKNLPAQFFIAAILPIFYTPAWNGTDLFLWAGLPFVVLLLFKSANQKPLFYVAVAGFIFGVLVFIRYSSLFIAIAAFFILLLLNYPRLLAFLKTYSIFLASSLLFILPLAIYNKLAGSNKPTISLYNNPTDLSTIPGLPEFVNFKGSFAGLSTTIINILKSASTISQLSGLPLEPLINSFKSDSAIILIFGTFCLILVFLLPWLVFIKNPETSLEERQRDISLSLSLVPVSLVILLLASNFAQDYDFIGTARYYIPVFLPTIFIAYELATKQTKNADRLIKTGFLIFISIFLAYNLIYRPFFMPGKRFQLAKTVLGSYLMYRYDYQYPSHKVITLYDDTSTALRKLQAENPEALFFVQDYVFYVYDGHEGLRTIPVSDFWKRAYVEKAVKIFWAVSHPKCRGICPALSPQPIKQLSSQPHLKTVYKSAQEKTKILVSDLPNGYKF